MIKLTTQEVASLIDHTVLKAETPAAVVQKLCREAKQYGFASVCVNPSYVDLVKKELEGSPVKVCTVIGFPLGANSVAIKVAEAIAAIHAGAEEIDMVINIGALKSGDTVLVEQEISQVVTETARINSNIIVKVIIETCYLSDEEKVTACKLAKAAGAHYVKTSTGFGPAGATVEDIGLMRSTVGPDMGVKASGGIRTYADLLAMIEAGASRVGASASVDIMQEATAAEVK